MVIYNGLDRLDFELRDHVGSLFPAAKGCLTCFVLHHRRRSRRKTDGAPNKSLLGNAKKNTVVLCRARYNNLRLARILAHVLL